MKRAARIALLSLIVSASSTVAASDESGNFVVKGVGNTSCREFIEAANEGGNALGQYFGYVAGYTSAFNELASETFDVWRWQSADTVLLILLQRCQRSPESSFGALVTGLTRHYAASKIPARVGTRLVGTEAKGFYVYEPVFDEIVKELRAAGYETADVYGALMQYKSDRQVVGARNVHQMLLLRLLARQNP